MQIEVTPGDVAEGEILLPHGAVQLTAIDEAGGKLPDGFLRFGLWTAKPDGARPEFSAVSLSGVKSAGCSVTVPVTPCRRRSMVVTSVVSSSVRASSELMTVSSDPSSSRTLTTEAAPVSGLVTRIAMV